MQLSAIELGVCNVALRTTEQLGQDGRPYPRQLSIDQLEDGVAISKKLKACVQGENFIDGDVEFSTSEKVLILGFLERPWSLDLAEAVVSLKAKLS